MQPTKIKNGRIITPMRVIEGGEVVYQDGKILQVGGSDCSTDAGCQIIDAQGRYVSPGFIDMHTHGAGGYDFMDGTLEAFLGAAREHARHGTTCLLPTSLACSDEELFEMFRIFRRAAQENAEGASMPGVHLEGPFFAPSQKGAQDEKYIVPPVKEHYEKILQEGGDIILRWSSAPELEGAFAFSRCITDRGIVSAIGHSDATDDIVCQAYENGYTLMTHLYSGMSGLKRVKSYRYPGVIESAYIYSEYNVEIIADGCHLPANLLKLIYNSLGTNRVALVTDSMRGAGMPDGDTILGSVKNGQRCVIEDGVAKMPDRNSFAGSVATAERLVRNMRDLAGAPIWDAVKMMTMTPARILGLKNKGILAPGNDADIVLFDDHVDIQRTIVQGRTVYTR